MPNDTNMAIGMEQGAASHGLISTYFSFSFSINLFAIFHAPKTRSHQNDRKTPQPDPHTFDTYLDSIIRDTSQTSLSPEIQQMQNAARSAYLSRLSRISDRASLQCLEKATKARLEWAARLDRESLEKLEFATRMLELVTPPKKERWQYEPLESEESRSSESKRLHEIKDSPCEGRGRSSKGQDGKGEMLNRWVERDIARVVGESDSRGKIENPFGAFGKDLDTMIAESEVLISSSAVKVQESEEGGMVFQNPFKGFFNSKQEDGNGQVVEELNSVELNPEFADQDQEEEAGSKDEEEDEWTDLGESQHMEGS